MDQVRPDMVTPKPDGALDHPGGHNWRWIVKDFAGDLERNDWLAGTLTEDRPLE